MVFLALFIAVVPTAVSVLFFGNAFLTALATWAYRALTFLVVSCPCALVISVPLTFFSGLGGASRRGILIKGSNYMDTLAKVQTVVFDKTGTLTKGEFEVVEVNATTVAADNLLHLAAQAEQHSTHPIALALKNAIQNIDDCEVKDIVELSGKGIIATVNQQKVAVGNDKLMNELGVEYLTPNKAGTAVHILIDSQYAGYILVADKVKNDAPHAIQSLRQQGVEQVVMLTGDRQQVSQTVAQELGISDYYAELLPQDKLQIMKKLLQQKKTDKAVVFVGDGINDAPVLALSDVGVAMGALGSDAAIEAADVVLMDDKPSKMALAIQISKRTHRIANQNYCCPLKVF